MPQTRDDYQDRHVAILEAGTAVFSDLALAAGVDDPVLNDPEDVGMPGVTVRHAEVASRCGARVHLRQAGGGHRYRAAVDVVAGRAVAEQVAFHEVSGSLRAVTKPPEHAVI